MSNDRKKERHRLKRKERQRDLRKARNASPYRALIAPNQPLVCYFNANWREQGLISLHCLKSLRNGDNAFGVFLIDLFCCGLKDAFGRFGMTRGEFQEHLDRTSKQIAMGLVPADVETVRRLVAGSIRFAKRNGFKLPHHYDRWIAMLDVAPDQPDADLADFGHEGNADKLLYIGEMDDLPRRLVSGNVEEFIRRPGVEYVARTPVPPGDEGDFDDEDAYDEELDEDAEDPVIDAETLEREVLGPTRRRMLDKITEWCFANHQVPQPRLAEAIDLMNLAALRAQSILGPEGEQPNEDDLAAQVPEPELTLAVAQLDAFLRTFKTPDEFLGALGPPGLDEEEEEG